MKIGDKVRFLSEVGGGRVAAFQGKDIVLVEDEDGFQVPMRKSDVVVIGNENYDTQHVVEAKQQSRQQVAKGGRETEEEAEKEPADSPVTFKAPPEERRGGDKLSAYLAFVPIDMKELSDTRFESYLVNDCNYYLRYVYMTAEGTSWQVRASGEVEPNTKLFIEEFGRDQLNRLERSCIQLIAYKRDKYFLRKPAVDALITIDPVKFYKLHTFRENQYFEQPALIYTIIENDRQFVKL
jgi:hypothetical protein